MNTKIIIIGLILLSFLTGIYLYPIMPDVMVSHWNAQGQPDGYAPKFFGLFFVPILTAIMAVLFFIIPKIDPLKENIEKFKKYYENFILLIIFFMIYIHALTICWNGGFNFDLIKFMLPAFGVLFYYCGIMVENAKKNYFIGIRTPWTLSSESVWDKTHKIGGKLFKLVGIITIFSIIIAKYSFAVFMGSVFSVAIYVTIYSYLEFKKEKREK